ncbi:MAG TPA: hypothetical protein VMA75_03930 [Candidatus Paceibacterota bacterium]|nr:hypothetical protein [Candidatus Paceibacterota bacterium]
MKKTTLAVIISIASAIVIFAVTYISSVSLLGAAWIVVSTILTIAVALIGILAGFVVVKSLFLIAAELSLLIFVAQSYCETPLRSAAGDDALRTLILLGVIYIAYAFVQSLYEAIKGHFKKIEKSMWTVRRVITTAVFLVFTVIFLVEIYLVVQPIIGGLCVYR